MSSSAQATGDTASISAVPDSMDAIVEGLLVAGLHNLEDDGLPMQTNEFYSKVVLACKPTGAESRCCCCYVTVMLFAFWALVSRSDVTGAAVILISPSVP